MIKVPQNSSEVLQYYYDRMNIRSAFNEMIHQTNNLDLAIDLAGLEFGSEWYGTKIQSWLEMKFGWKGIPQTENRGDFSSSKYKNVELKLSILTKSKRANFLNLRLSSEANHYMFIVRSVPKQYTKIFFLDKKDVAEMVDMFKEGSYHKHDSGHASLRINTESHVWSDPTLNAWSYLHQFEISFDDLATL